VREHIRPWLAEEVIAPLKCAAATVGLAAKHLSMLTILSTMRPYLMQSCSALA
jgi:hypothetical protein